MGSFGFWQPIIIFSLLNVILTSGLYITALSGQLSMATAALAGIGGGVVGVGVGGLGGGHGQAVEDGVPVEGVYHALDQARDRGRAALAW